MQNSLNQKNLAELMNDITDEYLLSRSVRVVYGELPRHIDAISFTWGSWYQIIIRENIPKDQQRTALLHELTHIAKNDFDREDPVEIIEQENEY